MGAKQATAECAPCVYYECVGGRDVDPLQISAKLKPKDEITPNCVSKSIQ